MVLGDGATLGPVDEIVAATGFRQDLSIVSELRLALDPTSYGRAPTFLMLRGYESLSDSTARTGVLAGASATTMG